MPKDLPLTCCHPYATGFIYVFYRKLGDTDLREGLEDLGIKMTKKETRRLVVGRTNIGSTMSTRRINFRQFLQILEGSTSHIATPTAETRKKPARSRSPRQSKLQDRSKRDTSNNSRSKGVTFRDDHDNDDGASLRSRKALRASLRRLVSADSTDPATAPTRRSVGPGLHDRLRGALQITAEGRGARMGRYVDRETIRRAMATCGAPLDGKLLVELERHFDRSGTGDIRVEVRILGRGPYPPTTMSITDVDVS